VCFLEVDVQATATGAYTNEVGGAGFPDIVYDDGRTAAFQADDAEHLVDVTGGLGIVKQMKPEFQTGYASFGSGFDIRNGNLMNMRVVLSNGTGSALTNIDLVDDIGTEMGPTIQLVGSSVSFNGTGCTATTLTADEATDIVTLQGATIPANGTCNLDFDGMITSVEERDRFSNTVRGANVSVDGTIYPFDHESPYLLHRDLCEATKEFNPSTVGESGVSRMTMTLSALGNRDFTVSDISFVDNFPAGIEVAANPDASSTCGGIIAGATPGSTSTTFTGGELTRTESPFTATLNRPLFSGDPEVRILDTGYWIMGKTKNGTRYPEELRARAVRMVLDHEAEYASRSAAILSISQKVGCSRDSLRIWVKQHETDTGKRGGVTTAERDRIKELERENRQLRQANEILKKASAYFAQAELDRPFRK